MHISPIGINLIKSSESCILKTYVCPGGKLTIGYGHTGPDVHSGMTITDTQAERLLQADIHRAEADVRRCVRTPLTQSQFDALVSFVFNLGAQNFADSTLLQKLNAGDIQGAASEFPRWVHAKGKVLPGLVKRRAAERALFLEEG